MLTALSYRRSGRADRRDKQHHNAELAADAAKKRAELVPVSQERMSHRSGKPTISVTNVGPAIARNVRAWLVDEHGFAASSVDGDESSVTIPRQRSHMVSVTVDEAIADEDVASLRWCVEWQDDRDDGPYRARERRATAAVRRADQRLVGARASVTAARDHPVRARDLGEVPRGCPPSPLPELREGTRPRGSRSAPRAGCEPAQPRPRW